MHASIPTPELSIDNLSIYSFGSYDESNSEINCFRQDFSNIHYFGFHEISEEPIQISNNSCVIGVISDADSKTYAMKMSTKKKRILAEYENRMKLPDSKYFVEIVDMFVHNKFSMLQMELCKSDIRRIKMSESQCWKLIRNVGAALHIIHSSGFLHMDVSPSNILIRDDEDDDFILSDFGTLIPVGEFTMGCEGSGPYASPEALADSDIVSYPSDIFSLGVTLLEAATGLYAPRGGSEKYTHLRTGAIKLIKVDNVSGNIIHFRPSAYFSNYSQQFVDVVNSMIDPVPDHRPTACQLFEIASLMLRKK